MMKVEFSGLSYVPSELEANWVRRIRDVINSGVLIGGKEVDYFEKKWAEFTGSRHAIGVGNGFDGLVLALRSMGIGKGHYVAVPAHTFIASWNAIIAVGAIPVGVDVDENGLIDLERLSQVIQNVDAVMPVHMHGSTVNMKSLSLICNEKVNGRRIKILEDASQAHGALCEDGSNLGLYSDAVVYSLYPTKNLGALGDAGIVTTNSFELYTRIKLLGSYGSSKEDKYSHLELGFNSRLDPIQASILQENLSRLPEWNSVRKMLSKHYIAVLGGYIDILQVEREDSVRHHFCVLSPNRDELRKYLFSKGISTDIHYPRVAGIEALGFIGRKSSFLSSEGIANSTLSLPISQWHTIEHVDFVASQVKAWTKL